MQRDTKLTDAGGRMIAEGLKGNCSVTVVNVVSARGLLGVNLIVLTCVEQLDKEGLSDALKRDITQGLQEGHGVDNGVAIAAGPSSFYGSSFRFYDFEMCEGIDLRGFPVRLISRDDVA